LATVVSDFDTLNAGNISRHTLKMDALYCVRSCGLVKMSGTLLKQKVICNKH